FSNRFESRLSFFLQFLKLMTGFFPDLVHLFALRLIKTQIIVELVDVALNLLFVSRRIWGGIRRAGHHPRCIEIGDQYAGSNACEEDREHEQLCFNGGTDHYCSSSSIKSCSTSCRLGTSVSL